MAAIGSIYVPPTGPSYRLQPVRVGARFGTIVS